MSKDNFTIRIDKTSTKQTIINIDRPMHIEDDILVPENVTLQFSKGGMLIFDKDEHITIAGFIKADRFQIFKFAEGDADWHDKLANITFKSQNEFFPEWWGIFPDIIPSNVKHFGLSKQMMLDIKSSNGGHLKFSKGIYYLRDLVIDFDNFHISGNGNNTILKFDSQNFVFKSNKSPNGKNASTRQGVIILIRGPHIGGNGNFSYNKSNYKQIENIKIHDLKIQFDEEGALSDPTMNGLGIGNAKDVNINNISVDLYNANRAFYIGAQQNNEKTENITIENCKVSNSRTGVFITHGFPEGGNKQRFKSGKRLSDISIINNHFNVSDYSSELLRKSQVPFTQRKYVDLYSSGIYITGNDYTMDIIENGKNISNYLGAINIENNKVVNADIGIRSSIPYDESKHNRHILTIKDNKFKDFKFFGIFGAFNIANIKNNSFDSKVVTIPPRPSKENHSYFFTDNNYCINLINKIKNRTKEDSIQIEKNEIINFEGKNANILNDKFVYNSSSLASL